MTVDFSKLGKTTLGEIKPPPVPPRGTYFGTITRWAWAESRWQNKETGQKEAQVHFTIRPTEFGEDIADEDKVGVVLKDKAFIAEQNCETDAQVYYMQEFLKGLGLQVAGKTLDQVLPDTIGCHVMFFLEHREGERGTLTNVRKLRAKVS